MNEINVSLSNTKELRSLILQNPELPIAIFAGKYANCGEYGYEFCEISDIFIQEVAMIENNYVAKEDYADELYNHLLMKSEYKEMTSRDFHKTIDKMIEETEFTKAIVICVD